MPDLPDLEFDAASFSGVARVFPLPAPSLFPRIVQPLHIFEDRYREMMRDALSGDGLIAMAVLKPGWETDYASRPPLEEVACLGKIVTHHELEDGRYNLLLAGVKRIRLIEEVEPPLSFRRARVELVTDLEPDLGEPQIADLADRLAKAFRGALPHGEPPEPLQQVFDGDTPLGLLADLAAYTLPIDREVKQAALAAADPTVRAELLIEALGTSGESQKDRPEGPNAPGFPPPFSVN
ncbi:MAG: LON peptidase substrate-binding domain-containing protein [Planctomycetota bacterium]